MKKNNKDDKKVKKNIINKKKIIQTEEEMINEHIKSKKLKIKTLEYTMDFGSVSAKISHSLN